MVDARASLSALAPLALAAASSVLGIAGGPRLRSARFASVEETARSGQARALTARTASSAAAITPGTVNRTSVNLTARYLGRC